MMQNATAAASLLDFVLSQWEGRWARRIVLLTAGGLILLALSFLERSFYAAEVKLVYVEQPAVAFADLLAANPVTSSLKSLGLGTAGSGARLPELLRSRSLLGEVLGEEIEVDGRMVSIYEVYAGTHGLTPGDIERVQHSFQTEYLQVGYDVRTDVVRLQLLAPSASLAADLANSLAERLNSRLVENATERARRQKSFIEERLASVGEELEGAELELKEFRQENRAIQDSPSLRLEEGRLLRAVLLNEQLYTTLAAQHELAKIEEVKNLPVIDVIDEATPPHRRAKPRRVFRLVAGCVLVCLLLLVWDSLLFLRATRGTRA